MTPLIRWSSVLLCLGTALALELDPGGFSLTIAPGGLGRRTPEETNVTIRAFPMAFLDNRFALSRGQPGVLRLAFNNTPEVHIGRLIAHVELPAAIHLRGLGSNRQMLNREAAGDVIRYAIDATPTKGSITAKGYNVFGALALVLSTDLPVGSETQGRYWLSNDDYTSPVQTMIFAVIPRVEGERPKRFETGVHFTANCIAFGGDLVDEYARFYTETGCNAAMIDPGPMSQHLRQMKVTRYHQPSWLTNGCMIGMHPRPETVRFQYQDGTKAANGVCPTVIYEREEPYFSKNLLAPLRRILVEDRATDHFLCNWEPFMFDFKGCFCDRCRREFAAYAKLAPKALDEIWPDAIIETHRDTWIAFRARQNARLVQTIEEVVNGLGHDIGREAHFVPEVHIKSITPLWKTSASLRQYATMAYADRIPLLNAWGPYPWQTVMQPYNYVRGYNLATHCLTRDSVDYIRAQIPDHKRPRLLGFPHGMQGNLWTTEPESMAMDVLTYFINEYDGQLVYAFPKGYDARYWRALAEANTAIAAFESFTLDGSAARGHTIEPLTPYPQPSPRFLKAPCGGIDAEKWAAAGMLQSWEYRLADRRLIAVANYWQRGDCFAGLSFPGLDATGRYTASEPLKGRLYATDDGSIELTAETLQTGLTVHVGAQRFAFFVLEPAGPQPATGTVVQAAAMTAAMQNRLADIQKAFAAEKQELGLADFQKSLQAAKRVTRDGVVLERSGNATLKRDTLRVRSRQHTLEIDVLGGGRVRSWQVNGSELVSDDPASGLALDGFWHPANLLTGPMELLGCEVENGQAVIRLRLPSVGGLPGLEIHKTLHVAIDTAAFTVHTQVHNRGEAPVEFSHRYHNMLVPLELRGNTSGTASFNGSTPASFTREFQRHMFTVEGTPEDALLTKAFDMAKRSRVNGTEVTFKAPWLPLGMQAQLPESDLHSIVFWDSRSMPCATFEPIHTRITVQPGQSWQTGMRWNAAAE